MTASFHDVRFPLDIALGARGGPERRTDIVTLGSGREVRNQRWAQARRRYEAGYGVKSLAAIDTVLQFFEERRGMAYGFRWRDRADYRSCAPNAEPAPTDQPLGTGDGVTTTFPLVKMYGSAFAPYARAIVKPCVGSVRVARNGVELGSPSFSVDTTTGLVSFSTAPSLGAVLTAGFLFDTPVRFDTDYLEIDLPAFEAGDIAKIPLVEIIV